MSINRGLAKYNVFIGQNPLHLLHKMKPFSVLYCSVERKKKPVGYLWKDTKESRKGDCFPGELGRGRRKSLALSSILFGTV